MCCDRELWKGKLLPQMQQLWHMVLSASTSFLLSLPGLEDLRNSISASLLRSICITAAGGKRDRRTKACPAAEQGWTVFSIIRFCREGFYCFILTVMLLSAAPQSPQHQFISVCFASRRHRSPETRTKSYKCTDSLIYSNLFTFWIQQLPSLTRHSEAHHMTIYCTKRH